MNNQPKPNTPSFTTLVKYPKTQSEIRDLIDSKEHSLETPLFLALVPTQYGGSANKWGLVPAIVYNAEQGVYRVGNKTCGQYEKADDCFSFHAIMLQCNDNEIEFMPPVIFISKPFTGEQTHISELFYPVPPEIYAMLCDALPAIASTVKEYDAIKETWGEFDNNALYYVWYALQARKQLIRNTLDIEAEEGKWQDPRFSVNWVDPVDMSKENDSGNISETIQTIHLFPDRLYIETIGDAKRAGQAGIIQGNVFIGLNIL